jgi:hypothetical protein
MAHSEWYFIHNGQRFGPVDSASLKQRASENLLLPADLVWKKGLKGWVPASRVAGLFTEQAGIVAPPPIPVAQPIHSSGLDGQSWDIKENIPAIVGGVALVAWLFPLVGLPLSVTGLVLSLRQSSRRKYRVFSMAMCLAALGLSLINVFSGIAGRSGQPVSVVGPNSKRIWDQMRRIDLSLRAQSNNPAYYHEQKYILYGNLDTDAIDPELRTFVRDSMNLSMVVCDTVKEVQTQKAAIEQRVRSATQLGNAIGSTDRNNPRGGAVAGELVFGMIGAAAANAEYEKLSTTYSPRFAEFMLRVSELNERQIILAKKLSATYGITFDTLQ